MSKCRSCGAEIIWIKTRAGKNMPCNATLVPYKQTETGKEYVVAEDGSMIRCTLLFDGLPTGMARVPHWATCPTVEQHRRKK